MHKRLKTIWEQDGKFRKLRVTSQDKQASMHAPRFGTQSKQLVFGYSKNTKVRIIKVNLSWSRTREKFAS